MPVGVDPRSANLVSADTRTCPPWAAPQIREAVLTAMPT